MIALRKWLAGRVEGFAYWLYRLSVYRIRPLEPKIVAFSGNLTVSTSRLKGVIVT
jgi:hypothetical protein